MASRLLRWFLALWLLLLVIAWVAPVSPERPVLVYGDSLTAQSEGAAQYLYPGVRVIWRAVSGNAMCDALRQAARDERNLHPARVVLAFTGNTTTSCAHPAYADGGPKGAAVLYEQSLRRMRAIFSAEPVTIVIPPAMHDRTGRDPFNGSELLVAMYKRVGAQLHMRINTSADDALTPGHRFVWKRPAFRHGSLVAMRMTDGVHLTTAGETWYGCALLR